MVLKKNYIPLGKVERDNGDFIIIEVFQLQIFICLIHKRMHLFLIKPNKNKLRCFILFIRVILFKI